MTRSALSVAIATLVLIASVPNVAVAVVWPNNLSSKTFGPVEVLLSDHAIDGCWTNLGEAKTYAEDKLRGLKYSVVSDSPGVFHLTVNSERMHNGQCYGSIDVKLIRLEHVSGLSGWMEMASSSHIFVRNENANNDVLNQIKVLIDEMAANQRAE